MYGDKRMLRLRRRSGSLVVAGHREKRPVKLAVLLVALGTSALLLAACGSSSSSGSSEEKESAQSLSKFQQAVDKALAVQSKWRGPTSGPVVEPGKRILNASCGENAEGCVRITRGVTQAAEEVGWESKLVDTSGDPAALNSALLTDLKAQKWDGLAIAAVDPNLVQSAISEAQKQGIPIVSANYKSEPPIPKSIFASVTASNCEMGYAIGSAIVLQEKGQANVAVFRDSEFPGVEEEVNCIVKAIEECSGCSIVSDEDVKVTQLATELPSLTTSVLSKNGSGVNVIATGYDAMAQFAVQGVRQSGRTDVSVTGYTGNSPNLKEMSNPDPIQTIDGAMSGEWMGYGMVDELNRAFAGEKAFSGEEGLAPKLLLASEELKPAWVTEGYQAQDEIDFRKCFGSLWKTGKSSC